MSDLNFKTLQGEVLSFDNDTVDNLDNEISAILNLEKQLNSADLSNESHIRNLKFNINKIAEIIGGIDLLPVNEVVDDTFKKSLQYINDNIDLFKKHGITEHLNAKKLEKITNPAFTETEYPPTIEEMKALEVDIGQLDSNA